MRAFVIPFLLIFSSLTANAQYQPPRGLFDGAAGGYHFQQGWHQEEIRRNDFLSGMAGYKSATEGWQQEEARRRAQQLEELEIQKRELEIQKQKLEIQRQRQEMEHLEREARQREIQWGKALQAEKTKDFELQKRIKQKAKKQKLIEVCSSFYSPAVRSYIAPEKAYIKWKNGKVFIYHVYDDLYLISQGEVKQRPTRDFIFTDQKDVVWKILFDLNQCN